MNVWFSLYMDCELGYAANIYESHILEKLYSYTDESTVFADVGAHIGIYSVLLASKGATVHAVEPIERNYQRIEDHAQRNGVEDRLHLHKVAASDSDGTADITIKDSERNSLVRNGVNQKSINTAQLDTLFSTEYPDLIKVDVEGAGEQLLDGAQKVLSAQPIWIVEHHTPKEEEAFVNSFESHGYSIESLGENHLLAKQ